MYSIWEKSGKKGEIEKAKEIFFDITDNKEELEHMISVEAERALNEIISRFSVQAEY